MTRTPTTRGWTQLVRDVQTRNALRLRSAATLTIRSLQQIGPNYSGRFQKSWEAQPTSPSRGVGAAGGVPYLVPGAAPKIGYEIVNTAPYAPQALDLEPGTFIRPDFRPKGRIVAEGTRTGPIRGDVNNEPPGERDPRGISTAERDWYTTYAGTGGFSEDFKKGLGPEKPGRGAA
jgi:hypothetical protein